MRRDPGVSQERTVLAWERTALAVVVAISVVTRLRLDRLDLAVAAGLFVGTLLLVVLAREGHIRGIAARGPAVAGRTRGGGSHAVLAGAVLSVAVLELAA